MDNIRGNPHVCMQYSKRKRTNIYLRLVRRSPSTVSVMVRMVTPSFQPINESQTCKIK